MFAPHVFAAFALVARPNPVQTVPAPEVRVVELVIEPGALRLDDIGPSVTLAHETFDPPGQLHVWATAPEVDLVLSLADAAGNELVRDDDSGGKPVPYVAFDVRERSTLQVRVAVRGTPSAPCPVSLHFVPSPNSAAARDVARDALVQLARAKELASARKFDECAAALATTRETLAAAGDGSGCVALADAWTRVLVLAMEQNDTAAYTQAARWLVARSERVYPPDHLARLRALGYTVRALDMAGKKREALAVQQQMFAGCERTLPEDHPSRVAAAQNLATLLCGVGDTRPALEVYERALAALARAGRDQTLEADRMRMNYAGNLVFVGELARARAVFERVARASTAAGSPSAELAVHALANFGGVLVMLGEFAAARTELEAAVARAEQTLPLAHPASLQARTALAEVWREQGEPEAALRAALQLLDAVAAKRPAGDADVLRLRTCAGNACSDLDDLRGAREQFQRVVEAVADRAPTEQHWLPAYTALARSLHSAGDFVGARAVLERALATALPKLGRTHPNVISLRATLAATRLRAGELETARELYTELLPDAAAGLTEGHPERIALLENLANVAARIAATPESEERARAALAAREQASGAEAADTQRARRNLASVLLARGDLAGASALIETCLAASVRALPADHVDVLEARSVAVSVARRSGDTARVRELARALGRGVIDRAVRSAWLAPREAREAVSQLEPFAAQVVSALDASDASDRELEFSVLETMRAAADLAPRTARVARSTAELANLARASAELRTAIADASSSAESDAVAALALRRDDVERTLRTRLAELGAGFEPVRGATVSASLGVGEAAVAYRRVALRIEGPAAGTVRDEEHLLAHVVRSDGAITRLDLGLAAELERGVETWRAALGAGANVRSVGGTRAVAPPDAPQRERELAAGLGARLVDPVLAAAGAGVRELRVCADDLVHLVPLDALPSGAGLAGERVRVRLRSSLAPAPRVNAPADATAALELVAVGNVAFGGVSASPAVARELHARFEPLPGTVAELTAIRDLFDTHVRAPVTVLDRDGATRAALSGAVARARYLHLATHGWFAGDDTGSSNRARGGAELALRADEVVTGLSPGLLCGLALAGANVPPDETCRAPGILTAEELAGLDLSHCELAVLSACDTSAGTRRAGLGIQSLQSAVHAAGARTAITSLWRVDDDAARRLMERFYALLWSEHVAPADALWRAKLAARTANEPTAAWAGWVFSESGG